MSNPVVPVKNGSKFDFQTPPEALFPLYPFLPVDWTVWECASGKGNLKTAFEERGNKVISTDLHFTGNDFLMFEPAEPYHCIVTNPPYDLKDEFIERACMLGKPFALLVPLTTFEGKKRQMLFNNFDLQVIMFDKRINFEVPDEKMGGSGATQMKKSQSWFMTMWITNGFKLPKQLNFVSYKGK